MHTVKVIVGGFVLLGLCLFAGPWIGGAGAMVTAAKVFIPIWLGAALFNMWVALPGPAIRSPKSSRFSW